MLRSSPVLLAASLAASPGVATAQQASSMLTIERAIVTRALASVLTSQGTTQSMPHLAVGTDVAAGFTVGGGLTYANALVYGSFSLSSQDVRANVSASCVAIPGSGQPVAASAGPTSVRLDLRLHQPCVLRFDVAVLGGGPNAAGAPSASIDVGDDGVAEVTLPPGSSSAVETSLFLPLPAGVVSVRFDLGVDLPSSVVTGLSQVCTSRAYLQVTPGHVAIERTGTGCGGFLDFLPVWDGESALLYAGPAHAAGGAAWLVFGTSPTNFVMPFAPFCTLLVDPVVVLPSSPSAWTSLPLGRLGPGQLLVQGVVLQPPNPWTVQNGLLASELGTLRIR